MSSHAYVRTPLGPLAITATEQGITGVRFVPRAGKSDVRLPHLRRCVRQVEEYFAGERRAFEGLPLAFTGTAFSVDVWRALRSVPYGATLSYGDMASLLRRRGAARAVGGAVGRNPLSILIPCHRVVGGDSLGGYAWGVGRKEWLLEHERKVGVS
ncbi:MAG: methylated-DNA--[protein]-cysteine S-methyltransferase [Candidatus Peribacteraceae bacterium]|jgi:methylated-DNA-[protein]-cysteine S-methyltransferase